MLWVSEFAHKDAPRHAGSQQALLLPTASQQAGDRMAVALLLAVTPMFVEGLTVAPRSIDVAAYAVHLGSAGSRWSGRSRTTTTRAECATRTCGAMAMSSSVCCRSEGILGNGRKDFG